MRYRPGTNYHKHVSTDLAIESFDHVFRAGDDDVNGDSCRADELVNYLYLGVGLCCL